MEWLEPKVVVRTERLKRDVVDCGDNQKGYVELRQEKNNKKKKRCAGGGNSMLCCQAEKCNADLHEAKQYHRRHKVCECHAKAQDVLVHGIKQRFCQQCSRFGRFDYVFSNLFSLRKKSNVNQKPSNWREDWVSNLSQTHTKCVFPVLWTFLIPDSTSCLNLMTQKEVVAGVWLYTMNGGERTLINLKQKGQATKGQRPLNLRTLLVVRLMKGEELL